MGGRENVIKKMKTHLPKPLIQQASRLTCLLPKYDNISLLDIAKTLWMFRNIAGNLNVQI